MKKTYTVWLSIEEYDEENDVYNDLDPGGAGEATFDTEEEAQAYVDKMRALMEEGE